MNAALLASPLALALLLAGCGENRNATPENRQASGSNATSVSSDRVYSGAGEVTAINGDRITISHGPIEGIRWPAMAMTFRAGSPDMIKALSVGDPVYFAFRQEGGDNRLTSIAKGK